MKVVVTDVVIVAIQRLRKQRLDLVTRFGAISTVLTGTKGIPLPVPPNPQRLQEQRLDLVTRLGATSTVVMTGTKGIPPPDRPTLLKIV